MMTISIQIYRNLRPIISAICAVLLLACEGNRPKDEDANLVFELLSSDSTGIDFRNDLKYDRAFNVYTYRNYYNGGGVAIGDINNDGLVDIYFTSNLNDNRLYLNKGGFKFEEIGSSAGVAGRMGWSTGVTMADVNGDGWLDIYVCNSGEVDGDKKENELFINNRDLTFTESAKAFGLNDKGYSTHASFFDYDRDGDLDVYLLNNSYQAIGSFNLERKEVRNERDSLGGDKLLRNNGSTFEDVSEETGILGSLIGFGLGVTVGDINQDGWDDIYVSNDFFERDYLYINNRKGSFQERLTESMNSISGASMGADMADINNDGYPELFVTEMLPGSDERLKTVTTFENWDKYQYNVENGYHHQFTRNTFQLNNQNLTFSEIGRLAGVEASDWSWGALIFDMDNDGLRDIFIANGIYQDLTDQDYLNYISNEEIVRSIITNDGVNYKKLIDIIPSNPVSNKAFRNNGELKFEDVTSEYGLDSLSFSNGAAYGDLDNDGNLDLVVNNVNMPAFVYRNRTAGKKNNWLRFSLFGSGKNKFGIGAKIRVVGKNGTYYIEQQPARGFQSSVDPRPLVGLGDNEVVDVWVNWPSGNTSMLSDVAVNQDLEVEEEKATRSEILKLTETGESLFKRDIELSIAHKENSFIDFNRDRLLYHMNSTEGPKMAIGDVNGDGQKDIYLCGAKGEAGQLLINKNGQFMKLISSVLEQDRTSEDTDALFFDADGDADLDLYVCSGGSEFSSSSSALRDRLYVNDGGGNFKKSEQILPSDSKFVSSSVVSSIDFDGDGDLDLFVGERMKTFQYGLPCDGFILANDGKGKFTDVTGNVAEDLLGLGMITTAAVSDVNMDGLPDLIVSGEYLPIYVFINSDGTFVKHETNLQGHLGWWSALEVVDIDGDGDMDILAGNHGLNSRFRASKDKPLKLYVGDFDKNGHQDPILTFTNENGKSVPYALRHNLADQLKFILKLFPDYQSFKQVNINTILNDRQINEANVLEANWLESSVFINDGKGEFKPLVLPKSAQMAPMYAIEHGDFDRDGDVDLLLGGNLYDVKPEMGRYDASYGVYLENKGNNEFVSYPDNKGFIINGQVRDIHVVGDRIWVSRNNDTVLSFTY
ncbi:MAG: CRTAC1 family protein [Bacteroidota bacterium]